MLQMASLKKDFNFSAQDFNLIQISLIYWHTDVSIILFYFIMEIFKYRMNKIVCQFDITSGVVVVLTSC